VVKPLDSYIDEVEDRRAKGCWDKGVESTGMGEAGNATSVTHSEEDDCMLAVWTGHLHFSQRHLIHRQ
jgi:hypothetical protein